MPESHHRRKRRPRPSSSSRRSSGVAAASPEGLPPRRRRRRIKLGRILFTTAAVVVGLLVIASFGLSAFPGRIAQQGGGVGAAIGDHWHPSLRMELCGADILLRQSASGVHSHGDKFIHIHPQHVGEAGSNANLGRFFDSFPMIMEPDRIQAPGGVLYQNGQSCADGQPGTVQVLVNDEDLTDSFRSYPPRDGDRVEVYFK